MPEHVSHHRDPNEGEMSYDELVARVEELEDEVTKLEGQLDAECAASIELEKLLTKQQDLQDRTMKLAKGLIDFTRGTIDG